MNESILVEQARSIAVDVHAEQLDKAGEPYFGHCERVAAKLSGSEARAAAFLHDVLEDGDTTEGDLRDVFGDHIVDAVVALTRSEDVDSALYYARIKANPLSLYVKLADINDNLDPERLMRLDAETRSYLMRKYADALQALA